MPNTIAIIQARMSSKRFPGKVLKDLLGKPVLEHLIENVKKIKNLNSIFLAIPIDKINDKIEIEAKKHGVIIYRGSEIDVRSRFVDIIKETKADHILRFTADKPFFDPKIHENALKILRNNKFDYVTNNIPETYPHGFDTEAFTSSAFFDSLKLGDQKNNIEHVTPNLRSSEKYKRANLFTKFEDFKEYRFTIDYEEDYLFLKKFLKIYFKKK